MKNLLVAQSGGPSVAINATLAGVIAAGRESRQVAKVYGGKNGIAGILQGNLIDLTDFEEYDKLKATPAMALGSCRYKLPPSLDEDGNEGADYRRLREIFKEYNIGWFLYIGGNDSMDTVHKLHLHFAGEPDMPKMFGLPKTIDNDLVLSDHTPGYGSAARYLAVTMDEIIRDTEIYAVPAVTIVEIMGRNAGWLTLAAGLPYFTGGSKPDIIAVPEAPFDEEAFIRKVREEHETHHNVVVAISEGIRDADGEYVGTSSKSGAKDIFGHAYLSGVGKYLEGLVKEKIGCKVRSIELNLMQRCSSHLASGTDIEESFSVGRFGVERALAGESGRMAAIVRKDGAEYGADFVTVPIENVANFEKMVPEEWLDFSDPAVKKAICDYILPLTRGTVRRFEDENGLGDYVIF